MEIIYICVGVFLVWLVRTLHSIQRREQEEEDKKIALAKQTPNTPSPDPRSNSQANDTEGTPS